MRVGDYLGGMDCGTGGRFYDDEESKAFAKKSEEAARKRRAFNDAARKKLDNEQNVEQNLSAFTPFIQKMQNASMNISISTEDLNEKAYLLVNQSKSNYAILYVCDKKFLMQLNHKDEVHIINQDMIQSAKHTPYTSLFENTDSYTAVHTNDTESLNKWAWSVFNTSIDRNCFSNLKPFLSYYN